jgi:hypothetical protein
VRPAGNFHPEWGYLVPMPSFRRTAGAALIAAAVGAASGVVAIVSLVARPGSNTYDKISVNALISHVPIGAAPAQAHANTAAAARPASAEKPSDAALPAIVATFSSNAAGRDGAGAPNGQARSTTVAANARAQSGSFESGQSTPPAGGEQRREALSSPAPICAVVSGLTSILGCGLKPAVLRVGDAANSTPHVWVVAPASARRIVQRHATKLDAAKQPGELFRRTELLDHGKLADS